MPIRLTTLGGLHAARDGVDLEGLLSQRHRAALLVYLAVERRVSRQVLTTVFWPESDPSNARHALRQALYQLRKSVGATWVETRAHELRITDIVHADVHVFEAALARGDVRAAATLYGGPFLEGIHLLDLQPWEAWVDGRRTQYARSFRKACREWVSERQAAGDAAGAVEAAQRWVAPDPTDDEAQHRLIEALASAGERADAVRQYEAYVRLLQADGLHPLDATVALADSLQRTETRIPPSTPAPAVEAPTPPAPASVDAADGTPSLESPPPTPARPPVSPRSAARTEVEPRRPRYSWIAGLTTVVLAVLGVALWRWPGPPVPSDPQLRTRLAVLPFQDDTREGDLGWLAEGLTTGLTDALHRVTALEVTPTSGTRPYRDGSTPLPGIAGTLGVDWLVAGSVSRRGATVVARAELIDAAGRLVDSREIAGAGGEALQLVGDVVEEVSSFLRVRIGDEVRVRSWSVGTPSEQAFRLVHGASRDVATADELVGENEPLAARQLLERADSALALAALADDRWPEPHLQRAAISRKLAVLRARAAADSEAVSASLQTGLRHAEIANTLKPGDPAALEMRGVLRYTLWLFGDAADAAAHARLLTGAEADLRSAVTRDSTRARALSLLSTIHFDRDEHALARATAERAYAADAYLDEAREILARLFSISFEAADDAAAERWCDELRRRFPDFWFGASCRLTLMAWAPAQKPDPDGAWSEMRNTAEATSERGSPAIRAQLEMQAASVLARAGLSDSAGRVLERARAYADHHLPSSSFNRIELLLFEAEARVLLAQREAAAALLDEYLAREPEAQRQILDDRRFTALSGPSPNPRDDPG